MSLFQDHLRRLARLRKALDAPPVSVKDMAGDDPALEGITAEQRGWDARVIVALLDDRVARRKLVEAGVDPVDAVAQEDEQAAGSQEDAPELNLEREAAIAKKKARKLAKKEKVARWKSKAEKDGKEFKWVQGFQETVRRRSETDQGTRLSQGTQEERAQKVDRAKTDKRGDCRATTSQGSQASRRGSASSQGGQKGPTGCAKGPGRIEARGQGQRQGREETQAERESRGGCTDCQADVR